MLWADFDCWLVRLSVVHGRPGMPPTPLRYPCVCTLAGWPSGLVGCHPHPFTAHSTSIVHDSSAFLYDSRLHSTSNALHRCSGVNSFCFRFLVRVVTCSPFILQRRQIIKERPLCHRRSAPTGQRRLSGERRRNLSASEDIESKSILSRYITSSIRTTMRPIVGI